MRIDIIVIYITSVVICISGASAWTPSAGAPPPPRRDAWACETCVCREAASIWCEYGVNMSRYGKYDDITISTEVPSE